MNGLLSGHAGSGIKKFKFSVYNKYIMVKRIDDGLLLFTEEHSEACNAYVIDDELVIDTGLFNEELKAYVMEKGIKRAVITHAHVDHVGGNYLFEKILMHPLAKEKIDRGDIYADVVPEFEMWRARVKDWDPLKEGDIVEAGRYTFEVFEWPGHSKDSICLHEPVIGWMFTGDNKYDGLAYFVEDTNRRRWMKKGKEMEKLYTTKVCGGHNEMFDELSIKKFLEKKNRLNVDKEFK